MTTGERRQADRIVFRSRAVIRYGDRQQFEAGVDTRDISLRGVFVDTDQRLPLDTLCRIDIDLEGTTSRMTFSVEGAVCRHDDRGMGICFGALQTDSRLHILNLMALHAAVE